MEDIEDLLAGGGGAGVPPGFRLPVAGAVGVNPKQKKEKITHTIPKASLSIPGTQVTLLLFRLYFRSFLSLFIGS